jgi:hypothetical protein
MVSKMTLELAGFSMLSKLISSDDKSVISLIKKIGIDVLSYDLEGSAFSIPEVGILFELARKNKKIKILEFLWLQTNLKSNLNFLGLKDELPNFDQLPYPIFPLNPQYTKEMIFDLYFNPFMNETLRQKFIKKFNSHKIIFLNNLFILKPILTTDLLKSEALSLPHKREINILMIHHIHKYKAMVNYYGLRKTFFLISNPKGFNDSSYAMIGDDLINVKAVSKKDVAKLLPPRINKISSI